MKKIIVLLLAAAVIVAISCATAAPAAELTPQSVSGSHRIVDEYVGDRQQGPLWFYMVRRDGSAWQELNHTREWGDNWQYHRNPTLANIYYSICTWEGIVTIQSGVHHDNSIFEVALAFRAPFDGTITIPDFDVISHGDYEAGGPEADALGPVAVTILHGTNEIATTRIEGNSGTVTGGEFSVSAGDTVYIYVDPLGVSVTNVIMDNLVLNYNAH